MNRFLLKEGDNIGNCIFLANLGIQKSHRRGRFKCKCGNLFDSFVSEVKNGANCGCSRKERKLIHGLCKGGKQHSVYIAFKAMKVRCYNKDNIFYKNYGGRGIYICKEWLENPYLFYEWSFINGWRKGLEIDRVDNNGPYSPNNCRWVTRRENDNNRRGCKFLNIGGKIKTYSQWDTEFGFKKGTIARRVKYGWSIDRIGMQIIK